MTDEILREYVEVLKSKGWRVELWDGETPPALNSSLTLRYPKIPADYLKFLGQVKLCENADETVWFLCLDDYNGTSDSGWSWDAMEQTYLEGEDDETRRGEVVEFWNRHLPFMLSVGGEYAYLAFRISDGAVVEGYEDLTEASERAKSFAEFIRLHSASDTVLFDYE